MTRLSFVLALSALLLGGCSGFSLTPINDRFDDPEQSDDPIWDDAQLVVVSPLAGELYELEEDTPFEAIVVDSSGRELDFDTFEWASDVDPGFSLSEATGSARLEPGQHVITVEARLPNGDRLVHAVGGVMVQSRWTGIWSGALDVIISSSFGGDIETGCAGGITFEVDIYGETLDGFGNCSASLLGNSVNVDLSVSGSVGSSGDIDGEMAISVAGFFDIPVEFEGELESSGSGNGDFEGSLFVADANGSFNVTRVN